MGTSYDFLSSILDEIALEGLDGITLKMLWQRLADRPDFPINVDEDSVSFFWDNTAKHRNIEIYELPEPRKFIPMYDRYGNIDPELGVVLEPPEDIPDPYSPVVAVKDGEIRGSCATYETRKCITSDIRCNNDVLLMSLHQVEDKWGDRLVLVASPKARLLALIGTETNPLIDLSLEAYCLLERIGRSRYLGEVTQGEGGLLKLKASFCKQLHYYRKKLTLKGLITKQLHYMRSRKGNTSSGSLFHLTRFYVLRKTKMATFMKQLCDILKDKPNNREICKVVKEELKIKDSAFKKLFYKPFQKWVKIVTIPCHEYYPNASRKECFTVSGNEKMIKVVQLLRHCDEEENNDEDEEEDTVDEKKFVPLNMHFDCSKIKSFVPLVIQVFQLIEEAGPEGISSGDLGRILTFPRLDIRNLLRMLIKKGHVVTFLQDRGRQKVTKYISKTYEDQNEAYSYLREQDVIVKNKNLSKGSENVTKVSAKRKTSNKEIEPEKPNKRMRVEATENGDVEKEKNINPIPNESNFQNIVSQVLEIQNHSHFTGKAPKLVSLSDKPPVPPRYSGTSQLTYRKLKRSNMILDFLKTEHFTTLSDLQKCIIGKEREEGYNFKLDKKSTARLVYSLYNNKKLKIFKAVLKLDNEQTSIEFICDNSLESSDPRIQVAIEQAKFKFFGVSKECTKKIKSDGNQENSINEGNQSDITVNTGTGKSEKLEKKMSNTVIHHSDVPTKYPSITPKFCRTKALHLLLYYLVYQHKGDPGTSDEQRIYHDSISWKRFIPPLPDYGKEGWCFLADIYSRMPLSLFVKLINFRQGIPGLNTYLENEEKCHYLIKFLPQNLRNSLLNNRKYLFSTNDVIRVLCHMGLVSMGPQLGKLKDQVFLYIHKKGSLKDTTISPPGYMHIKADEDYETKVFEFTTESDIETFWIELESICFHTPLGKFSTAAGKTIAITEAHYKPELAKTMEYKNFEDVSDDGLIPGDGLGAAGFDSALFMHSRRNWQSSCGMKPQGHPKDQSQSTPLRSIQHLLKSKDISKSEHRSRLQRLTKSSLNMQKENDLIKLSKVNSAPKSVVKCSPVPRKKTKIRTVRMRTKKKRCPYYDEKDKAAMEKLDKARCDWSPQEDSFLLLCKVASSFLDPHYTKNLVVPYTVVRDLLHEHVPGVSANKSSRACQRRVRYMMLNPTTLNNVAVFLGEALQDVELVKEFNKPKPSKTNIAMWQAMFTSILKKLREKFTLPASDRCKNLSLPYSIREFREHFEVLSDFEISNRKRIYKDPESIEDITKFVLNSLVLSAMAIVNDGTQWSFLLHRLYQRYPENVLQSVVTHLRKEKIIAVKKRSYKSDIQRSLRSTCPYKFSITYNNAMLTKFPVKVFRESRELINSLTNLHGETGIELKGDVPAGYAAAVLALVTMQKLSLHTEIPDQIILFDSSLSKEARTNIVERMINTLSDKESAELTQLLSSGTSCLSSRNTEESEEVHSTIIHDNEMADADLMSSTDMALTNTSQLNEGQRFQNASRFALYLLRQEMSQPPMEKVQHSQDYIILNSCRVFCQLKPNSNISSLPMNPSDVIEKTSDWEKNIESEYISKERIELTKAHISEIEDIVLSCIPANAFVERQSYIEPLEELYDQYSPQTFREGQCIFHCIYDANLRGITEKELWCEFRKLAGELSVFEHLDLLRKAIFIIRVGVVEFTYVCCCFASLWVLKSYHLPNIYQKPDKQGTASSLINKENLNMEEGISKPTDSKCNTHSHSSRNSNRDSCPSCLNESLSANDEAGSLEKQILDSDKKNTPEVLLTDVVYFIARTWRNPDGTLNRIVFFELLSTVLSHIIAFPGVSSSQVCEHFLQVMPPVQTLELIEVLEKANCVYKYYCKLLKKSGLFSSKSTFIVTENPEPEDVDHLESFPDAVCKIAQLQDVL